MNLMAEADNLVVTIKGELDDEYLDRLRERLLAEAGRRRARGVIIDLSAVGFMDAHAARVVEETAKALSLMGAETVLCGIGPGLAASLVDLQSGLVSLPAAGWLEDARGVLEELKRRRNVRGV